jgi:hypothetical protein
MISHSIITLVWMLVALGVHFIGVSPFLMAASATGWWWSREQYWDELKLRNEGRRSIADIAYTVVKVWWPERRNMDLIAPAIVAWVMATGIYILL